MASETEELMWRCSLAEAIQLVLLGLGFGYLALEPLYLPTLRFCDCLLLEAYGSPHRC